MSRSSPTSAPGPQKKRKLPLAVTQALQKHKSGCASFSGKWETYKGRQVPATDHLPAFDVREYKAQVVYACTRGEVEDVCKALLAAKPEVTGWDLEWPIYYGKRPDGQVALMQIAYKPVDRRHVILLLQVRYSGFPPSLQKYLSDPSILKTGLNAEGDRHKMKKDFDMDVAGVTDLFEHPYIEMGRQMYTVPDCRLSGLTAQFLKRHLVKGAVRTGNWDQRPLSHEQQSYAAADALASLEVYKAVEALHQAEQEGHNNPTPALLSNPDPAEMCTSHTALPESHPTRNAVKEACQAPISQGLR